MAKLYFLPLFENVYKPYYKHNNQINEYKKTPFERCVMPVFHEGARIILPKYQKVGDYQDFGDERWFRKPYNAREYFYNVVTIQVDGGIVTTIKHMVTGLNISSGSHTVKIDMCAYNYNPREKSGAGLKGTQIAKDSIVVDLQLGEGDYYIVATHKTQHGAYIYESPYNDGTSCIKNTFFEYHSVVANVVSRDNFLSHFDYEMDFSNIDISSLKDSMVSSVKSSQALPKQQIIQETRQSDKTDVSVTRVETKVPQTPKIVKSTNPQTQKKLTNDEYFDMLVESITSSRKTEVASTTGSKPKESAKPTPIKYITDSEPRYAELYEDGTLAFKGAKEVYVPRQVKCIDKYFLWKNEYVKKVVLADGIISLENKELCECPNLEEVVLPKNLEKFKFSCISYCPKLKSIYIDESNPYYCVIDGVLYEKIENNKLSLILYPPQKEDKTFTPPSNCIKIDYSSFYANSHILSVDLKDVQVVDLSAFSGCKNLRDVTFGKGLKAVHSFGFDGTALDVVELPFSAKLGNSAFPKGCKVKKKLIFK